MTASGSDDRVIVLRSGADSEMVSGLGHDETRGHRRRARRGALRATARCPPPSFTS
jgi:hypothetical protein